MLHRQSRVQGVIQSCLLTIPTLFLGLRSFPTLRSFCWPVLRSSLSYAPPCPTLLPSYAPPCPTLLQSYAPPVLRSSSPTPSSTCTGHTPTHSSACTVGAFKYVCTGHTQSLVQLVHSSMCAYGSHTITHQGLYSWYIQSSQVRVHTGHSPVPVQLVHSSTCTYGSHTIASAPVQLVHSSTCT